MPGTVSADRHSDDRRWSALMAAAQAGSEADYRLLLSDLGTVIQRYLVSRIGPYHFVEDCVQESLIAIHQARHTYDPRRPFRPWLFAIVRHKAIDALRRQHQQSRLLAQLQGQCPAAGDEQARSGPDDAIACGRLLALLSPDHRQALTLTRLLGLSNAEAARRLNISESALKLRVHRATGKLRRLMEVEGDE